MITVAVKSLKIALLTDCSVKKQTKLSGNALNNANPLVTTVTQAIAHRLVELLSANVLLEQSVITTETVSREINAPATTLPPFHNVNSEKSSLFQIAAEELVNQPVQAKPTATLTVTSQCVSVPKVLSEIPRVVVVSPVDSAPITTLQDVLVMINVMETPESAKTEDVLTVSL